MIVEFDKAVMSLGTNNQIGSDQIRSDQIRSDQNRIKRFDLYSLTMNHCNTCTGIILSYHSHSQSASETDIQTDRQVGRQAGR